MHSCTEYAALVCDLEVHFSSSGWHSNLKLQH